MYLYGRQTTANAGWTDFMLTGVSFQIHMIVYDYHGHCTGIAVALVVNCIVWTLSCGGLPVHWPPKKQSNLWTRLPEQQSIEHAHLFSRQVQTNGLVKDKKIGGAINRNCIRILSFVSLFPAPAVLAFSCWDFACNGETAEHSTQTAKYKYYSEMTPTWTTWISHVGECLRWFEILKIANSDHTVSCYRGIEREKSSSSREDSFFFAVLNILHNNPVGTTFRH